MSHERRWAARALAAALLAAIGVSASAHRAQGQTISIALPILNDSVSPAPPIVVQASALPQELQPQSIELVMSLEPVFSQPFFVADSPGNAATFQLDTLLKPGEVVYLRARLFDQFSVVRAEATTHVPVRSWVRLITPGVLTNNPPFTRQPQFVWSSPGITLPPGPWTYTVTIINTATGQAEQPPRTVSDTSFVPEVPLDACTSYKWSVLAAAQNGGPHDTMTVTSPTTFVLQTPDCPTATIFYQNFPNPFGGPAAPSTCFWFDLAEPAKIRLTIYDIRLRMVRKIIPGPTTDGTLAAGAFGRLNAAAQSGCDPAFAWDGRDDAGRFVPPGVYLAVFEGAGKAQTKKILYRGR